MKTIFPTLRILLHLVSVCWRLGLRDDVQREGLDGGPRLLDGGRDLLGRQQEAVLALVAQLDRVHVLDRRHAVRPVT